MREKKTAKSAQEAAVRIAVRAKPRAKVSRIVRAEDLTAHIAIAAQPVDGAANEELIRILSDALRVPKRDLALVVGSSAKQKLIAVTGLSREDVVSRLNEAAALP